MTPGLAMIMSLAACGSEQASSGSGKTSPTASGATSISPASGTGNNDKITVSVRASAKAPAKTWTLTCDPAGGDHPKADQACASLAKVKEPFKAPPKDQICTKIYGGPEVATVTGTWAGKPVDAKFTRTDGCELSRWSKLSPLFGDVPKVR
jgi:hypothetical protein